MSDIPDDIIEFPTLFSIKALGTATGDFEELVIEIVGRHVPHLNHSWIKNRSSSGGKYMSVTVTFIATSRDQLDAIYRELGLEESIIMVL
jgi:putative lipoic acid-binding regulatory protein